MRATERVLTGELTCLPRRHCLKSVEKTSIIAQGSGTEKQEWHHEVQLPKFRLLVPWSLILGWLEGGRNIFTMHDVDVLLAVHDVKNSGRRVKMCPRRTRVPRMMILGCLHHGHIYIHRLKHGGYTSASYDTLQHATGAMGWESGVFGSHLLRGDKEREVSRVVRFTR